MNFINDTTGHLDPQNWKRVASCLTSLRFRKKVRTGYSLYSLIDTILTHPIDTWQPHNKIELSDGFGIPINQFLVSWTNHELHQ